MLQAMIFRAGKRSRLALWVVVAALSASPALAQMSTVGPQSFPPQYEVGAACERRSDDHPGVVKVDACGRIYCGRVDQNDITVLNPRLAQDMNCTWRVVEGERCKCVRN